MCPRMATALLLLALLSPAHSTTLPNFHPLPKRASSSSASCATSYPTPRAMPQGSTPRYPIQITLSSSSSQQGSQQSQTSPVTVDLNFAYPNSSSSSPLEARTSYYSPFDLNLDDLTSTTSDSNSDSDSDGDLNDNDDFTAPKTDSTSSSSSPTNTTNNTLSSSSNGPCTLLLNLTSPAAQVSGAATVNIYSLDGSGGGSSPGTLVGTTRFEKGAAAVVNSFACLAEGEEMGFQLEVAGGASASSTSSASAGATAGADGGGDGSGDDGGGDGGDGSGSGSGSGSGNGSGSGGSQGQAQSQGQGESVSFLQGDEEGTGLEMRWGC